MTRRLFAALLSRAARYEPGDSYVIDCIGMGVALGLWHVLYRWITQ